MLRYTISILVALISQIQRGICKKCAGRGILLPLLPFLSPFLCKSSLLSFCIHPLCINLTDPSQIHPAPSCQATPLSRELVAARPHALWLSVT